jgi:small subunit ribosomal protein S3
MGQKVNPIGFRLGMRGNWPSKCYVSNKNFPDMLYADIKAREFLQKKYVSAAISRIEIERLAQNIKINLYSARPGSIIGKSGRDIDNLRNELARELGVPMQSVYVNIREIRKPDLDAKLVAESIAAQLVKRVAFRRAMKKAVSSTMKAGAEGIKICASGRLGGAEIARTEWTREGRIPLHTLRADIDYALAEAHTTYGIIGVKVWICKGEMLEKEELDKPQQQPEQKAKAKHEVKHHAVYKKSEHHDKNDEKVADHKHKDEGESATKKTKVSETKEVKETKVKRVTKTSKAPAKAKSHAKKEKAKEE